MRAATVTLNRSIGAVVPAGASAGHRPRGTTGPATVAGHRPYRAGEARGAGDRPGRATRPHRCAGVRGAGVLAVGRDRWLRVRAVGPPGPGFLAGREAGPWRDLGKVGGG